MSWKDRLPPLFREIIDHDNQHKSLLEQNPVPFLDLKISIKRKRELQKAAEKYIKESRNPDNQIRS